MAGWVHQRISNYLLRKSSGEEDEIIVEFVWTEGGNEVLITGNFLNTWETRVRMEKVNGAFRKSMVG